MKIGLLGSKGTSLDLLHNLRARGKVSIDVVISLKEETAEKNKVAFFEGKRLRDYCRHIGIPLREVANYTLRTEADLKLFRSEAIDLLIVLGWERLLPSDILQEISHFACGMHGSSFGLPRGRGRSPMNWSLIAGKTKFVTSLFRYDSGVDSGDIIGTSVFDINDFDSIETLHAKNRIAMIELLENYVPRIVDGSLTLHRQTSKNVSYYPKRTADDGAVDWTQSTAEIYNLVRAVAPPYPGAFTFLADARVCINWAQPFDTSLFARAKPGTILDVSVATGKLVVATGDGSILLTQTSGIDPHTVAVGARFESADARQQLIDIVTRYDRDIPESEYEIRPSFAGS